MVVSTKTAATSSEAPIRAVPPPSSQEGGAASAALLSQIRDLGRTLDDVERARIQVGNRIAAISRGEEVVYDGQVPPAVLASFDLLVSAEEEIVKEMERTWRKHPLYGWSRNVPGVGDKLISRLLAEIGDPTLRPVGHFEEPDNARRKFVVDGYEPRSLSQLLAYTGHGDPARRKRASRNGSGMSQAEALRLGNPVAKKRLFLIAKAGTQHMCPACKENSRRVKAERKAAGMSQAEIGRYIPPAAEGCVCAVTHPLRFAYDSARAKYSIRTHDEGVRVGQLWADAHIKAAALRYTGKVFLKMLHAAALDPDGSAKAMKERRAAATKGSPSSGTNRHTSSQSGQGASS